MFNSRNYQKNLEKIFFKVKLMLEIQFALGYPLSRGFMKNIAFKLINGILYIVIIDGDD